MAKFVFISSMLTQRLTGQFTTDHTMAGTSMMTNLTSGNVGSIDFSIAGFKVITISLLCVMQVKKLENYVHR